MQNDIHDLHDRFCQDAEVIRNLRPNTIIWYRRIFGQFMAFYEGKLTRIEQVTYERLEKYFYEKRLGGWKASNFLNQYKALKSFLKWAEKRGHIAENPILRIERPKLETQLPKALTQKDAEIVLDCARYGKATYSYQRHRDRAVLAVMVFAGLRAQEALDLKLDDVDLDAESILVRQGKGAKDRYVPISPTLSRYLQGYLRDRSRLNKQGPHFFTRLRGNGPLTYTGLMCIVDRIKNATGVNFTPHRLRHTFATMMLSGGCDLFSLQKMLGHSSIQTTTIYLSASANLLQRQIVKHPLG